MTKAKVTFPSAPDTSAIDIKDEGSLIVSNPTAMNFTGPGVTVTENPTGTAEVDIPGLQYWTESESAAIQQNTRWIPNNAAANVTAVVQPKGTGAFSLNRPDGLISGGNARGNYAVDLQLQRDFQTKVASGINSFLSGLSSTANGSYSFCHGRANTSSGAESAALGGTGGTASGNRSVVLGGANGSASGQYANVFSSLNGISIGGGSRVSGYYPWAYMTHMDVIGIQSNSSSQQGNRQYGTAAISNLLDTTHTTGQVQTLGTFNPPTANRAYNIVASWTAVVIGISGTATGVNVGDYMTQCNLFGFKRVAGTGSITSITTVATHGDASMTGSASMGFSAVSNNLQAAFTGPTFAGGGTLTIRAFVKLQITEIAWTV